ncbi:hypothetical protein CkaCkLH20_05659 [Colletotrichum karsti]|uniref:tripeptidyl-peptidase II n=1 Tax=Colletotrichum karsti TaxID=1095194 RepID=A0A9P6I5K8_9PEZI|nr:uncharacterized protein CkaCkLH20_05659 [Colletotrichum karsti]KAF9876813.1 hypothetical protein CkaCkLH20_05659 [Colletotrichum karsti]
MAQFSDWTHETEVAVLDEVAAAQDDSPDRVRPRESSFNHPSEETNVDGHEAPRPESGSSHWDPRPGFAHIDGDVNGPGYNETLVDIVCVPCPGADPVETWARDPLPEGYFGHPGDDLPETTLKELAGASILSPTINRHLPKAAHLWVRQGIRKDVNKARVLLYRHREMIEGLTLDELADDLIEQVWSVREGNQRSRPLFFIAHSIGGLVVESALLKATQSSRYKPFMYNCHGVTFFATPHRGSSYLSMRNLENSIQRLLRLQRPLPQSISNELRLGHKPMLKMHDKFATIAAELKIWSFYETIDSQLSGTGSQNRGTAKEVRFGAPIVSIKSSLVGVRQERVFALDSEHANCASFGLGNTEMMSTYLKELAAAVTKATYLSSQYFHNPLSLKKHVKVEIIGFYDDPDAELESDVRLYFTKLHLQEFLDKGPERCLEERLRRTTLRPRSDPVSPPQLPEASQQSSSGLGILAGVHELGQRFFGTSSNSGSRPRTADSEESAEMRMIWEYIGYDPPLNYRRTLDQFAYPSLRDTWARDDDQMLYKLTKNRASVGDDREILTLTRRQTAGSGWSPTERLTPSSTGLLDEQTQQSDTDEEDLEEVIKDGKVLMVDQLWLWAIDTTTVTTFFSKRESKPKEGPLFQQADLRNSVYNELNGDLTGRCENSLDLAAFIVLHAITVLLDRASHPDLEVFRIFEEAISMLTERMTSSLKRFRMQTFKDTGVGSDSESNRPESIKKRHKRELQEAERENRENTSALMELRDLEDELKSLERLFEQQDGVVKNMKAVFESDDLKHLTRNGRMFLDEALDKLEEYKSQTTEMLKRVDTTRNDYEKLLEMVQRQAQVDEVRWSRLQTELASSQNLSVMTFTTFTVIFLPLSFFTSLFGMNTIEWDAEQGKLPSIRYIGAISLPLSVFLIGAALIAAFSTRVQEYVRIGYKGGKGVVKFAWSGVKKVVPEQKRQKRRDRIDREEKEARKTRIRDRGYDFWATVRRERGIQNANQLLDAEYSWFRNEDSGKEVLRTLKYSLPLELKNTISLISPTTRFCSHPMMHTSPSTTDSTTSAELRKHKRAFSGTTPEPLWRSEAIAPAAPVSQAQVDASCNRTVTPSCIRALYNVPSKLAVSPARGLGVYASQNQVPKFADFALFAQMIDPPSTGVNFSFLSINGGVTSQDQNQFSNAELNFDLQYTAALSNPVPNIVTAVAGDGPIKLELGGSPGDTTEPWLIWLDAMLKLPDDKLPHTITTSFGENEQSLPDGYVQQVCNQFGALGARGVTMFAASGDSGPGNTCVTNDGTNSTRFNAVFPAACPFVTGVGGVRGVAPERASDFSSGSFSDKFARPAYQNQAVPAYLTTTVGNKFQGLFNASGRGFPDVSAQSFNATFVSGGQFGGFQGTSAAAPIWAGMVGMVNAALIQAGKPPMGFINPWLYGAGLQAVNDVTTGASIGCTGTTAFGTQQFPPQFGAKLVPGASWPAAKGWDAVTGLGSPDIGKMLALRMAM